MKKQVVVAIVLAVVLLGILWALAAPAVADVLELVSPPQHGKVIHCPTQGGGGIDEVLNSWKSDLGKAQIRLNTPTAAGCRKQFLSFTKSGDTTALTGKCTESVVQKTFCINGASKKPSGFSQAQFQAFCTWVAAK